VGHGPPQNKEKTNRSKKKKKNVKFGSNFSHSASSQKKFGPIFRFYGHIKKFWPYSKFFGLYPLSFYFYFWPILSNAYFFSP
jgi:hypothetical protein